MTAPQEGPLNPLPPVVWLLALPVIAMETVLFLADRGLVGGAAGIGWRLQAIERFAFAPSILGWMWDTGRWGAENLARTVLYVFVQASFTQALFVVVFLLALGKMVAEVFRPLAVLTLWLGASAGGALIYALVAGRDAPILVGGYPAVYGLIGGFTFLLWVRLGIAGANRYRAFSLIGVLMGIRLLFGILFDGGPDWIADLAGFCVGFVLSFVLVPGGFSQVLARLRSR
ncbi:MAG: rhomboid family intramembrane serine protease [Gemmobacter sp.]